MMNRVVNKFFTLLLLLSLGFMSSAWACQCEKHITEPSNKLSHDCCPEKAAKEKNTRQKHQDCCADGVCLHSFEQPITSQTLFLETKTSIDLPELKASAGPLLAINSLSPLNQLTQIKPAHIRNSIDKYPQVRTLKPTYLLQQKLLN